MDGCQFDDFARRLTSDVTRRRVVGRFGGAALGTIIAMGVDGASVARKKKKRKKKRCKHGCGECRRCKKGKCKPKAGHACGDGGTCLSNGSCALSCKTLEDCPPACFSCAAPNTEGESHCVQNLSCDDMPRRCS
ncbi:MAG TPA: hypothetical protein VFX03_15875, partial [Thermomicrobiales bacterium]|nr:hypothetical protein [Thermomicrobiales bacterium]